MGKVIYEDKLMQDLRRMGEIPDDVRVKVLAAVSRQPAADVAPVVHGRWIPSKSMALSDKCSVCHGWVTRHSVNERKHRYCPSCGAKMDGGNADGAGG